MPFDSFLPSSAGSWIESSVKAGLLGISSRVPLGTNVFSREWDLLVILDTCRPDALAEVADEYDFLPTTIPTVWSVGSSTREWVGNTFTESYAEEIEKTAVVTANTALYYGLRDKEWGVQEPVVRRATDWNMVDNDRLLLHDKVWDYAPGDPWTGLPIPDAVTDRTIATGRDVGPERCIAHYLAPHVPYRSAALTENRPPTAVERDPWETLRHGADEATVWNRYLDEIRSVLDQVERLLSNYDADRVVITADHGELFGEAGLYSHPSGIPHPNLRRVPWVQTEATDTGSSRSRIGRDRSEETRDVRDQLAELGYVE